MGFLFTQTSSPNCCFYSFSPIAAYLTFFSHFIPFVFSNSAPTPTGCNPRTHTNTCERCTLTCTSLFLACGLKHKEPVSFIFAFFFYITQACMWIITRMFLHRKLNRNGLVFVYIKMCLDIFFLFSKLTCLSTQQGTNRHSASHCAMQLGRKKNNKQG